MISHGVYEAADREELLGVASWLCLAATCLWDADRFEAERRIDEAATILGLDGDDSGSQGAPTWESSSKARFRSWPFSSRQ